MQIKDLIEGAKAAAAIAGNAGMARARPAQFSCPEAEMVERVREVLEQDGVSWGLTDTPVKWLDPVMPGLVPGIHVFVDRRQSVGIYLSTCRSWI